MKYFSLVALLAFPSFADAANLQCTIFELCLGGQCRSVKVEGISSRLMTIPLGLANWRSKSPSLNSLLSPDREIVSMVQTRSGPELQWDGKNQSGIGEFFSFRQADGAFTYLSVKPGGSPELVAIGFCEEAN